MANQENKGDLRCAELEKGKNFDLSSYRFSDIDLEMASRRLPMRDRKILILYLMGHRQIEIAEVCNLSRSTISKRMNMIVDALTQYMLGQPED